MLVKKVNELILRRLSKLVENEFVIKRKLRDISTSISVSTSKLHFT